MVSSELMHKVFLDKHRCVCTSQLVVDIAYTGRERSSSYELFMFFLYNIHNFSAMLIPRRDVLVLGTFEPETIQRGSCFSAAKTFILHNS